MNLLENVDSRGNSEVRGNISPVNNAMLTTMSGVLERSTKKLENIIKRLDIPIPLSEPDERNETSTILSEVDQVLDTAIRMAKNEPSANVMLSIVLGMLEASKKRLRGVIRVLDIPRPLGDPYERNKVSRLLCEVVRFLEMATQVAKNELSSKTIEGRQALAIEI